MDGGRHLGLARVLLDTSESYLAIAAARTGLALGASGDEALPILQEAFQQAGLGAFTHGSDGAAGAAASSDASPAEALLSLPPVLFHRLSAVAARIEAMPGFPDLRLLDVGGGNGQLCTLLPDVRYCLADPGYNGLAASDFPAKSFDVVVCCHVLEHIPDEQKEGFLEQLCEMATDRVLLLGPVANQPVGRAIERLVFDMTRAQWAKEHMDCGMPELKNLERFAEARGYGCEMVGHGNMSATYWTIFARYFAAAAGRLDEFARVSRFSNENLDAGYSNPDQPNDFVVEFRLGR